MNRGSAARGLSRGRRLAASMRPRFMNRGSHYTIHKPKLYGKASMRPRFMNRGSVIARFYERVGSATRFNEAPIHESGKCPPTDYVMTLHAHQASMRPRFMNRGSSCRVRQLDMGAARFKASMRPRFMNRGSEADGYTMPEGIGGFNEAPIHESGKYHDERRQTLRTARFNEAPIHESGKFR